MANAEIRLISRRQQQWLNAHEREEQERTPDLFCWWLDMRTCGQISTTSPSSLIDELRTFNATQLSPLPFGAR
jgi:hypothetical protein